MVRLRIRFQGETFVLTLEESAVVKDLQNSIKILTKRDDLKSNLIGSFCL